MLHNHRTRLGLSAKQNAEKSTLRNIDIALISSIDVFDSFSLNNKGVCILITVIIILIYVCIIVAVIAAWLISIKLLIQVGEAKGFSMNNRGLLWFIGIFATPIATGLYVIALPNKSTANQADQISTAEKE